MSEYTADEFLGDAVPSDAGPSSVGDESSGSSHAVGEIGDVAPQTDATPAVAAPTPATSISNDTATLIARERLPAVAGETEAAALRRLYDHQRQRADRLYYEEVRGAKTAAQAARDELLAFKTAMDPLVRAFHERRAEAEQELAQSKVPEVGTPEYLAWQQQQIIAKMDEREQREAQERAEGQELAQQEALITLDEAADYHLDTAINSDPEARAAYEFAVQLGLRSVQRAYPQATPEQQQEVVRLSHILDMRSAMQNGVHPGDWFKQRMADVRSLAGIQPQAPTQQQPARAANGKTGKSATAQQLAAAKAQAPARAVVSPSPTSANPPSGNGVDFAQMDEDTLLEFVLADAANAAEYSRWIEQKHGNANWR